MCFAGWWPYMTIFICLHNFWNSFWNFSYIILQSFLVSYAHCIYSSVSTVSAIVSTVVSHPQEFENSLGLFSMWAGSPPSITSLKRILPSLVSTEIIRHWEKLMFNMPQTSASPEFHIPFFKDLCVVSKFYNSYNFAKQIWIINCRLLCSCKSSLQLLNKWDNLRDSLINSRNISLSTYHELDLAKWKGYSSELSQSPCSYEVYFLVGGTIV